MQQTRVLAGDVKGRPTFFAQLIEPSKLGPDAEPEVITSIPVARIEPDSTVKILIKEVTAAEYLLTRQIADAIRSAASTAQANGTI